MTSECWKCGKWAKLKCVEQIGWLCRECVAIIGRPA